MLLEVYAIGDGYQSCRCSGWQAPLTIELHAATGAVASAEWRYGDILCGHADPLTFSVELEMSESVFNSIERAVLPPVTGSAQSCS